MGDIGKPRKIIEPETGREWRSLAALSKEVGYSVPTVAKRISAGDPIGARLFVFADDLPASPQPKLNDVVKKLREENYRLRQQLVRLRNAHDR